MSAILAGRRQDHAERNPEVSEVTVSSLQDLQLFRETCCIDGE
jgi:hypothetical protein